MKVKGTETKEVSVSINAYSIVHDMYELWKLGILGSNYRACIRGGYWTVEATRKWEDDKVIRAVTKEELATNEAFLNIKDLIAKNSRYFT